VGEIKCGPKQRRHKESEECFTIGLSGGNPDSPCGLFMQFYEDVENKDLGYCDCKPYEKAFTTDRCSIALKRIDAISFLTR